VRRAAAHYRETGPSWALCPLIKSHAPWSLTDATGR
jgi:hypothetical protein